MRTTRGRAPDKSPIPEACPSERGMPRGRPSCPCEYPGARQFIRGSIAKVSTGAGRSSDRGRQTLQSTASNVVPHAVATKLRPPVGAARGNKHGRRQRGAHNDTANVGRRGVCLRDAKALRLMLLPRKGRVVFTTCNCDVSKLPGGYRRLCARSINSGRFFGQLRTADRAFYLRLVACMRWGGKRGGVWQGRQRRRDLH